MADLAELKESIKGLSLIEAATLVKELEEELGVSAAPPVAVAAPVTAGVAGEAGGEEKTAFDVILVDAGGERIKVIKEVRAITGLGLKEAKELVEAGGKAVKEGLPKKEAEEIKKKLEGVGAKVELK